MRLLTNLTANTTGSEAFILNGNGGSFLIAIPASASLGGGTLVIEFSYQGEPLPVSTELTFTALPEPKLVFIASNVSVRAQLTGSTAPSIPFLELVPADQEDKNTRIGRI